MGVVIGEADGEHVLLAECGECGERYETDETMDNDCPHCGGRNVYPDVVESGDPDEWR